MTDLLVIGGGAAGLMAAGAACARGLTVTVLEHNPKGPGQKLLITGKGRCNVTSDSDVREFLPYVRHNGRFLYSSLYAFPPSAAMELFESLGVPLKTERGRRVFPRSDRAADVLATPLARRIAQDQGVDLSAVAGTGCHGKVTKGDVLAAAQSSGAGFAAVQAVKADITCLLDLISQLNGSREKALSLDAFFLKAAALAVQKLSLSSAGFSFAVFGGGEKEQPVVAGAESLSLSRISAQIGELTEKALSHTLSSKETLPAAFGVCDMSSFGVYAFTPVLRSGETGIFGLAAPEDALVLEDGQVTVHKTAVVCLRYDARVLSEAQAAQLLSAMKSLLQTPMEILL